MSPAFYKVLHLLGVCLLFTGIGGLCAAALSNQSEKVRKISSALHGSALLILLVAGFGSLAKLGMSSNFRLWMWIKLSIWLLMGAAPVIIKRSPSAAVAMMWLLPLLGALSAYLGVHKGGAF